MASLDSRGEIVESISSTEDEDTADVELVHRYDRGPAVLFAVARTINADNGCDDAAELIRQVRKNVEAGVFGGACDLPDKRDGCPVLRGTGIEGNDRTFICAVTGNGDADTPCPVHSTHTLRKGLSMAIVSWPNLITSLEPAVEAFINHEANLRILTHDGCSQAKRRVAINPLAFGDTVAFATSNGTRRYAPSLIAQALRGKMTLREICRDQAQREVEERPGNTAVISLVQFTRLSGDGAD